MHQTLDQLNNPSCEPSPQKVLSDLRQGEAAHDCLRQFLEHERPGTEGLLTRSARLTFLESDRTAIRHVPDLASLEREIRPVLQTRSTTSHPSNDLPGPNLKSIPFYSAWFDPDAVHPIERQNLPEFFGEKPSKSPKVYLKIRNFLVHLYWRNPRAHLHATTARRCLALDAPSVLRVHAFLESWGLINLQSKNKTLGLAEESAFDFVRPDSPRPVPSTADRETPFETRVLNAAFEFLGTPRPRCFQCQQPVHSSWASQIVPVPETQDRTTNRTPRGLNLCLICFGQDNYPVFFSARDFAVLSLPDLLGQTPSLALRHALLNELREARLDHLTFADLQAAHPETSPGALLSALLQAMETRALDQETAAGGERVSQLRRRNELSTKMGGMLESLVECVSSGTADHNHRSKSREHTLKPLVQFGQEIAAAFAEKMERTSLRLAFLEDFERVLYHQKLGLKSFN